ncbi:hypothetical protein [Streptomyces sp. NBC_00009]|uniref:hypothetical protein n=1 Tax=Streptomyces sp. NBC_00009 TaxID=2975620 RepID=UPI00324A81D4
MTLAVGIFDLFTYGIPGALHLSLITYILARWNIVDLGDLTTAPSAVQVVACAVASYLLGHLAYPLSALLDKVAPRWNRNVERARLEFLARVPEAQSRAFVHTDISLLLAAVELHDKEVASEITRLRGLALMLRNSALALAFALLVAVIEVIVSSNRVLAGGCAGVLLASCIAAVREGRLVQHFDRLKTLEICFWIPDIDSKLGSGRS